MRLALATRHRVERPAMSMEGGTVKSYGAAGPAAVCFAFDYQREILRFPPVKSAKFVIYRVQEMCFTVKHISAGIRLSKGG